MWGVKMRILMGIIIVSDITRIDAFVKECKSLGIIVSNIELSEHDAKRFRAYFHIQNNGQYEALIRMSDLLTVNYAFIDHTDRLAGDDLIYI